MPFPKVLSISGAALLAFGCHRKEPSLHSWDPASLAALEGSRWEAGAATAATAGTPLREIQDSLTRVLSREDSLPALSVRYPRTGSIFPPDIIAPTVLWTDSGRGADFWVIETRTPSSPAAYVLTSSPALPAPVIDSAAIPPNTPMVIPDPNRFRNWRPTGEEWEALKARSREAWSTLRIFGFNHANPYAPLSRAEIRFMTSRDSVNAPIFYRDVPIMPTKNETGRIQPLSRRAERLIRWSLRDVSRPAPKTVIATLPTCANCHSFSDDGKTVGLDLDGPQSDKGTYGLAKLKRETDIGRGDVFSWNYDFQGKRRGKKTIGFLSRVSPDGKWVATTVNEEVYIHNYMNNQYIQVFFPTRGVIGFYSQADRKIKVLPGADDTAFVHCDPVWSPDGKYLVFARARAKDPYAPGQPEPEYPNDPNETQIQYDLYRIPFNGGRGGKPEPVAGASANGMSNSFPKVSPDGKHIVFVKAKNGQLMRPDGRLWMVPFEGGQARLMDCNLTEMNSWHSFSPNGRWMVFSSKGFSYYTQMFLTHLDADGGDSPPILISDATAANRAVNLPEFVNVPYADLDRIDVSAVKHMGMLQEAYDMLEQARTGEARVKMQEALATEKQDRKFRSEVQTLLAWLQDSVDAKIAMTREALRTDPAYPLAHFNLGSLLEHKGRMAEAVASYRNSYKYDSTNAWALVSLARIHMQSPDPKLLDVPQAVTEAELANKLSKYREPSILKTLARAYSEAGRFPEAVQAAQSGLSLAKQQGLAAEAEELQNEIPVYEHGKSFTWALKKQAAEPE